ncbi:hypothetical protein M8J76_005191 [Diaphorina citri]|nr:hypothetical protein M8J76_005191 [Diaphorina citri]
MKRVGGNVSIEKGPQPKSSAVTITPATSNSSYDDNNDDNYYDEDEDEEFEPNPPVIHKPNLSQVQITPRNVSQPALNITPVLTSSGSSGNRGLPQVSTSFDSKKIPDRPFKIFSKEGKGLLDNDDDIIIESSSIKSPNSFVKPTTPVKNLAPPIRAPNLRMNRPVLPPPPPMSRARTPSPRHFNPRSSHTSPMRGPLPQTRPRLANPPLVGPNVNYRPLNRGRPRGTLGPPQRMPNQPGPRMQMNPRHPQNFPRQLSSPRTPNVNMSRAPMLRGAPLPKVGRPTGPASLSTAPTPTPFNRKISNQVQITPRPTAPKPQPSSSSQNLLNVKEEPKDYEEEYEDNYSSYKEDVNSPAVPRTVAQPPKLSQVNITPRNVAQPPRNAAPVPRVSSSVQITPKVSSQVQITPRPTPHVVQAKSPSVSKHIEDDQVNIKEEPMEQETDEHYEDQGEDYYDENEEGDYEEEEKEREEALPQSSTTYPQVSSAVQLTPVVSTQVQMTPIHKQTSVTPRNEVLPATPVSFENIKKGPIIKEEPKEEGDTEMQEDYYDEEENYTEENYDEQSYETGTPNHPVQTNTSQVLSSVQITQKLGSQVQLTPRQNPQNNSRFGSQSNSYPKVANTVPTTPSKFSPRSESEEQFDESFEEEAEEEEEYYDEEMEDEDHKEKTQPLTQESDAMQSIPSPSQTPSVPNKIQNVSITPNPVTPKKMSGVSITPNKPQAVSTNSPLPKSISITPNVPKGISVTPNVPKGVSMTLNVPKGVSITPNVPKGISMTPNVPRGISMTPNVSKGVSMTPNVSKGVSMTPNVPKSVSLTPNVPKGVSITPNVPKGVTMTPNVPKGVSITPNVPKGISITPNVSKAVSITPKTNSEESNEPMDNINNPESEEYYEEEVEEEESFEDYEEDGNESVNHNQEPPELSQVQITPRNQAPNIQQKKQDSMAENIPIPSSIQVPQKSSQMSIAETRQNLPLKPNPNPVHMNPPTPQGVKSQYSTPSKPSVSEPKKQGTQGKSPSTTNYQSPARQTDSGSHGRPRSLIEAISMISSGKLSVSNDVAPTSSKKTTPKKEESSAENSEVKLPIDSEKEVEASNSNEKTNSIETDEDVTKQSTSLNSEPPVASEEQNIPSTPTMSVETKDNTESNETENQSMNKDGMHDVEYDNVPSPVIASPKMKMRPKSKLLQFRKQSKNPTIPQSKTPTVPESINQIAESESHLNDNKGPHSDNISENSSETPNETLCATDRSMENAQNENCDQENTDEKNNMESDAMQEDSTIPNNSENIDGKNDSLVHENMDDSLVSENMDNSLVHENTEHENMDDSLVNENMDTSLVHENTEHENMEGSLVYQNTEHENMDDSLVDENMDSEQIPEEMPNQPDTKTDIVDQEDENNFHYNDTMKADTEEAYDNALDTGTTNEVAETCDNTDEFNENFVESKETISKTVDNDQMNPDKSEALMEDGGDIEMKEDLSEDMAEQIMREQEEFVEKDEDQSAENFNAENSEKEEEQAEEEEEEGEEEDEEEGNENSDEEAKVEEQQGEGENAGVEQMEGEAENNGEPSKKKPKKKGSKKTKKKKKTAKRKSMDALEETPAAKKNKTESPDDEKQDDKEDGDKSGSNKAINLRKNIRDVIDENQLDPATLAAQREEAERLKRVQEQQQRLKEVQRQIAQNNKAAKMMEKLEGENSGASKPSPVVFNLSSGSLNKQMLELLKSQKKEGEDETEDTSETAVSKLPNLEVSSLAKPLNITSSVSLVPVKKPAESGQKKGKDPVTVSDSDEDCILISEPSDNETEEEEDDPNNSGMHTNDTFNVADEQGRVLVNLAHDPSEPDIFLAPQIARIIKPHQIGGIRFLFDNIIESTERYKTSPGFGCILAHSMGLGKTLQIVSFSDIFLRHTEGRTVVCIMPINTLQNWVNEFNMWLPLPDEMSKSPLLAQGEVIKDWRTQGGVLMIGYELYRQLSLKKPKKVRRGRGKDPPPPEEEPDDKKQVLLEEIYEALVNPGPDLVICDEGHRIKNSHASTSHALKQIRSRRRVVLTGYPLQNNLLEYWCMVDFVRPNYLGTKTEFSNMFERPIQNGQCVDSTPQDVRLMRYRAHVRSHMVLQKTLPVKEEYVLLIRMTPLQRQLYETFMNEVVRTKAVPNPLKAFAVCCKIWNHPDVLYNFLKKRLGIEDVVADLDIEENPSSVPTSISEPGTPGTPVKRGRGSRGGTGGRNSNPGPANKNAKKGSPRKGTEDPVKSPAVATVMPNTVNPPPAPGYNYNYPGASSDNYNQYNSNPEANTFPSPAYYNNPDASSYWNQTPSYSNTSGYHTDNSSNFTDMTESSMGSMASSYNQNMNTFTQYNNDYNTSMMSANTSYNSGGFTVGNSGNTFGHGQGDVTSSYNNPGFTSTNNTFNPNVNNSMYSSSPFDTNLSTQSTSSFNSAPFNQTPSSFNESGNMYNSNQMSASTSSFNTNPMPPVSSSSDLDTTGGLVDMMLNEFPTPNPFDETSGVGQSTSGDNQSEEKKEESEPVASSSTNDETVSAGASEEGKGEVSSEGKEKENADSSLDPEKTNSQSATADSSTPSKTSGREEPGIPYDWAEKLMKDYIPGRVEESNKMVIFMCILEQSLAAGDRMLVFSQSLFTLTLIEQFLQKRFVPGRQERWARNRNYFRLDGSTISTDREKLINEFNANPNVAMFLVSTRAGSLGINLVGANRVIVFDASWNPCHDTQAVCRVYRYGQQKPCFVYRLVMDCCLEKKIYDRQINKQGMADRVVDECNPDAHLSIKEVTNLCWDNEPVPEEKDFSPLKEKYRDSIIQLILDLHSFKLSKEPFQHESLLVDRKDKKLSTAEKRLAKRSYELEKQANTKPVYFKNNLGKPMASVRPMQTLPGNNMLREGIGAPRNRQWIPAEVWQKQGMSAQEMTLPLDVVIPTNSNERSIVLKAGQKVMVLKSPKGIYMQLENGKIIAIRTANNKGGPGSKDMLGGLGGMSGRGVNRLNTSQRSIDTSRMNAAPRVIDTSRVNTTPRVIDSRYARDMSLSNMRQGPRPRHLSMPSRVVNTRASILHRPTTMGSTPRLGGSTPRLKNVSITPSRPPVAKKMPSHSVSCSTSPPPAPSGNSTDKSKPDVSDNMEKTGEKSPLPSTATTMPEYKQNLATNKSSSQGDVESTESTTSQLPVQEITTSQHSDSTKDSSFPQPSVETKQMSFSQAQPGESQQDMSFSQPQPRDKEPSFPQSRTKDMSFSQPRDSSKDKLPFSQAGALTKDNPFSQPRISSMLGESQSVSVPAQDDLSLMNFDPTPSSSMDYSYDYPHYTGGGTSDFYSTSSYQQHTPVSTPASSYVDTTAPGSSYPYDMYSGASNVNPFTAAAAGTSSFSPLPSYQSSAFHRPEPSYPPPPTQPYPPQYSSDFYPPPP